VDAKSRQKALRSISNGIYVLTTRQGHEFAAAMVSWVTQVSFKPPRVMVALQPESRIHDLLMQSRRAVLHILAHDQLAIARTFLHATERNGDQLNGEPFREDAHGMPVLSRVASSLECEVQSVLSDAGDHVLVIMDVVHASHTGEIQPLLVSDSPWSYGG
jgi:flavin reductase (DIM6/NTAB) family NADH-FMN oxidoreductase RutF